MYGELILEDELTDAERFEVALADARRMMRQLHFTAMAAGKLLQATAAMQALLALDTAAAPAEDAFNKDD